MKASIIIPNYNGRDLLEKNLPRVIQAYNYKKNNIKEIIIVDDASTDDSVTFIKENYPSIKLVQHKKNRRFAATVNTGARSSVGDIICLLNTDVIPSTGFIAPCLGHFKDKNVFGVSLNEQEYSWAKGIFRDGYIEHEPGKKTTKPHNTFWISGGSGLFRRSMWMELKGMDEKLFKFYWEDLDLSYRALKRGYRLLWEPKAIVEHKHETTNKRVFTKREMSMVIETNQLVFIWKNLTSSNLFRKHISGLVKRISKHPGYTAILLRALTRFRRVYKARKIEKKEAKLSDEAIFSSFT